MSRRLIVLGDMTSSGGHVVSGSPFTDIDGKPVARINDIAVCPMHKGSFPIVTGDPTLIIDGQPVARHGDSLACGCKVLAVQQISVFIDQGGGSSRNGIAAGAASVAATMTGTTPADADSRTVGFDQAIRFVSASGAALAGINYILHLENGEAHSGVTDGKGTTRRIETKAGQAIVRADLSSPVPMTLCCAKNASKPESATIDLVGVSTTNTGVGTSVQRVEAEGHERPLTAGEINMAKQVFGDAVDYKKVKVHNHGYWMFLGLQDKNTAVTPNGEMYMPQEIYKEDYSTNGLDQSLFMHEMIHVWQYQLGYGVKRHGLTVTSRGAEAYRYSIGAGMLLDDFNMEQQGDIISDYYMIVVAKDPVSARGSRGTSAQLTQVLSRFLADPGSKDNLPKD